MARHPVGCIGYILGEPYEAVLVWTQAELAVPAFQKALAFEEFSADELVREVNIFCLAPTGTEAKARGQRRRIQGREQE